jgi:UDP-N-acetylglucosamine--N-acetylmuramyl-(pentapeptide) pyrophosphoryl-undecaprenol N-acetylglucosamine transferase
MKFVITSGGTAGHIYPALAVASELQACGHELLFAGTPNGAESRLVPEAGIAYTAFKAAGFNRSRPWTLLTSTIRLAVSTSAARRWLALQCPDAVAGFGGYVSVPVGRAAAQLGIPLLIHEQNSAAGWANRYLAKQAQVVALSYQAAHDALAQNPAAKLVLTGNPVRRALLDAATAEVRAQARADFRAAHGIAADARVLLVFGGSQGARHINQALVGLRNELLTIKGLQIIHITGANELNSVRADLADGADETGARWLTMGYCDDMPAAYAASDIAVSRAGAGALAELSVMGLPAILVPYPYATDDHQTVNAQTLVAAGAAIMIPDAKLDTAEFGQAIINILTDIPKQLRMQQAARSVTSGNAAATIANLLTSIAH